LPSIHSSESPELGWLVPCLAVGDLPASLDFYARLGLVQYGGNVAQNWVMLRNRAIEIHLFKGHIEKDLLNFRGGDPVAIRAAMKSRGLEVKTSFGEASFIYRDPDGREVFFDTGPEEIAAYQSGQPLTGPIPEDDVHAGTGLDLGNLTWCLSCANLQATSTFYETLGLIPSGGRPESGWVILARRDHLPAPGKRLITTWLSLFAGMIPRDTINFRGGNVAEIAEHLAQEGIDARDDLKTAPDGGESLLIVDPDERPVFFDTTPPERLY
jgi:catechol 2,3-dioxygenase-like lactoylglutathione lyase family enzyme